MYLSDNDLYLTMVDTSDFTVKRKRAGTFAQSMVLSPDGRRAYLADFINNTIEVVDL